jgi:transcriptional regulator with XRE-family HTH domain
MEIGMTQEQFAAKFGVSTAAPKGRLIPPSPATATHATRARYTRWAVLFL